jgi:hypothetical protein
MAHIVGETHQKTSALHPGVNVLDDPFVQDLMQDQRFPPAA